MRLKSILPLKSVQVNRQCMQCQLAQGGQGGTHCGRCGCCKGHAAPIVVRPLTVVQVCEINRQAGRFVRGWN
jgi:hypothetical protein